MTKINRVSESVNNIISVTDIEDYLQDVWDRYKNYISNYRISRLYESGGEIDESDEILISGEEVKRGKYLPGYGCRVVFDVEIGLNLTSDNIMGWTEFIPLASLVDFLNSIKSSLTRLNVVEVLSTLNYSTDRSAVIRGAFIHLSIITNITT